MNSVEKIIEHENYNNPDGANSIAVFEVKGSIQFNEKVKPIEPFPIITDYNSG